jgi:CubicO group peptidase (beta-lactamase class C family)
MKVQFLKLLFIGVVLLPGSSHGQILQDDYIVEKNHPGLYAVVITKNHSLLYEHYFNKKTSAELFNDQSLTKSIVSILIGIAIDKGYISSLDEKIIRFFPELKKDPDQRKREITIRQIMNQASGLHHEELTRLGEFLALPDPSGFTLRQFLLTNPGTVFQYNNAASHLLSVIITKATGMGTLEFANQFLFRPLQIGKVDWMKMKDGYYDGSGLLSIRMSIKDMNRIGLLMLDGGRYMNHQIVSSRFVQLLLNPVKTYQAPWGFPGSEYALCWYHKNYEGIPVTYGLGWGGQFNFIIPSLHAVITVNESVDDEDAIPRAIRFQTDLFPQILRYLQRPVPK